MGLDRDPELLRQIGQRIAQVRRARGFTQEALAEVVGIQPHGLSRIEGGHRGPAIETLATIAKALGMGVGELLAVERELPPVELSAAETRLLRLFRELGPAQREALLNLLKVIKT